MIPLSVLREKAEKATPGPWMTIQAAGIPPGLIVNDEWDATDDEALIVALVNAAPMLLDALEAAQAVVSSWERLGTCEDEFGNESEFCGEHRQLLDDATAALAIALAPFEAGEP